MAVDHQARRCPTCLISWPVHEVRGISFETCPSCQEPTDFCSNVVSLNDDEAHDLATHFQHDRHYAEWDDTHDPARLIPANATDEREIGIYKRAQDLLSSRLTERAQTAASATS